MPPVHGARFVSTLGSLKIEFEAADPGGNHVVQLCHQETHHESD